MRNSALILLSTLSLLSSPVVGAAIIAGQASAGCGKPHIAVGKTIPVTINSTCCSDVAPTRNYTIHLPINYNPDNPTALIISYHGAGETPSYHENESQLSNVSYNPDMIVVYPEGFHVSFRLSHRPMSCCMRPAEAQLQTDWKDRYLAIVTSALQLTVWVETVGRSNVCQSCSQRQNFHHGALNAPGRGLLH